MSPDVVTKFYYLQHGSQAPKNSEYKGIISTGSIIGFKSYTKRKQSKMMSAEAAEIEKSFLGYTQRFGAEKTFSSIGWLDTHEKNEMFKDKIAECFRKDGDLIWTPIISLSDFMTSAEMKLFNEEDYATAFSKILPDWFKTAGFDNENMSWWMDYHVNTDNPHVHLSFFENQKTRANGKLPMKDINDFKNKFWKEVFSKKRYLEKTGKSADAGFKNKDLLKRETYQTFKQNLKTCTDKELLQSLKQLYKDLPKTGRLQYNSSNMIPYREKINSVVDKLLNTPEVSEKYLLFKESIKEFDEVRNSNLHTKLGSFFDQEDHKLRVMLANEVLGQFKNIDQKFWEREVNSGENKGENMIGNDQSVKFILPVAGSLVTDCGDVLFTRVPRAHMKNKSDPTLYVELPRDQTLVISEKKEFRLAEISGNQNFKIYNKNHIATGDTLSGEALFKFFDDGKSYLKSWQAAKQSFLQKKDWAEHQNDWKGSVRKLQKASFSWMNQIEHEVAVAQEEYLLGKEMTL